MRSCRLVVDVDVRLLGPVELRVDGLLVPIERVQVRRLLALVAMQPNASVPSDQLIEELWPGDLPQSPRAALRVVASRLRHALARRASRLRLVGDAYRLDLDAADVASFDSLLAGEPSIERIATALALWRGPPFSGAHGPPALDREAARLERCRGAAGLRQAELLLAARSFDRAVNLLTPTVEEHPTDEHAAALLARALSGSGRRTDALAVLRRARTALLDGYGLDPDGPLVATEQAILATPERPRPAPAATTHHPQRWLLGRDDVIEAIERWLGEQPPGAGARCVLIEGPAGIGKSALAVALAERLGRRTVHAHCDPDRADAESLRATIEVRPAVRTGDALSRALAIVDALVDAVQAAVAGGGPLTLVIDDLQWSGEIEARFLAAVVRRHGIESLTVMASRRTVPGAAGGSDNDQRIARLAEHDHVYTVLLPPLDPAATRAAYSAWGGRRLTAPGAEALLDVSGGVPYLIRAIAMTGQDPAALNPSQVAGHVWDTVRARLAGLDAETQRLVGVAAALGRVVDLPVLAATCAIDTARVATMVDRAVAAGLLAGDGPVCRFDHELTRVHLARAIGPATALVLHHAAVGACTQLGRDAVVVADHVLGAGLLCCDDIAVRRLLAGADLAGDRGVYGDAARFLARAAELEPDTERRMEIELRRAWALGCAGDRPAAESLIDEVFATARQHRWPELMARAALAGSPFGAVVGGNDRRRARLTESLAHPPSDDRLRLDVVAATIRELDSADRPIPAELLEVVEALAVDDDTRTVRLGVRLFQRVRRVPATAPIEADAVAYVDAARETGDALSILEAEELLTRVRLAVADIADAEAAHADLARTVRRHRWPRYVWSAALLSAVLTDLRQGSAAAEAPARRAMAIGREHGVDDAGNAYAMFRLSVAYRHGGLAALEPFIRAATESAAAVPAWHAVHAAALADAGEAGAAEQALRRFFDMTGATERLFHHVGAAFAVRAACRTGELDTLPRCVEWLVPWSGNLLIAGAGAACYGPADLILAEALLALGDTRAPGFADAGTRLLAAAGAAAWPEPGYGNV